METLVEALERLRALGYASSFSATDDGELRCEDCDTRHDPATMRIDETVRFEGSSNPGDEGILLALRCSCEMRGVYTSAYGPAATTADSAVLTRLP